MEKNSNNPTLLGYLGAAYFGLTAGIISHLLMLGATLLAFSILMAYASIVVTTYTLAAVSVGKPSHKYFAKANQINEFFITVKEYMKAKSLTFHIG